MDFNYQYQVWHDNGLIDRCGHPDSSRPWNKDKQERVACCNAHVLQGYYIEDVANLVADGVVILKHF